MSKNAKTKQDEILDFINRRFRGTDAHWFDGNCYWFAAILCQRFPQLEIFYMPVSGHFIAGNGSVFFDASGQVCPEPATYAMRRIQIEDPALYKKLIRDCVL